MKRDEITAGMIIALFLYIAFAISSVSGGTPSNPEFIFNSTETVDPWPQAYLNTTGGSFTTLVLNTTAQDYKWKAYVGNATGKLALSDQENYSIYDWDLSTISGNVFVTRNDSVDWQNLSCAEPGTILAEDTGLNINSSRIDSINRTFNDSVHKGFYAANNQIVAGDCPAISTYVNGTAQSSGQSNLFQEVLLQDTFTTLIYTTILEDNAVGFDNNFYDFQMIVAEDETAGTPTKYYFYLELV